MNCFKLQDKLSRLLTDDLSAKEKHEVTAHLAQCEQCRRAWQQVKAVSDLLQENQPIVKMPYATEIFLPQLRKKIQTKPTSATNLWPRLIPALTGSLMVFLVFVIFFAKPIRNVSKLTGSSDIFETEHTVNDFLSELDENAQNLIAAQMLDDFADTTLMSLESELYTNLDEDELIASLNEEEQDIFTTQILTQYEEARDEINPEWLPTPVKSEPTSSGG